MHPLAHRLTYNLPAKHGFNLALSRYRTAWTAFATFAASRPRPNDRGKPHPPSSFAFFVNADSLTANVSTKLCPDFREHQNIPVEMGSKRFLEHLEIERHRQILETPIITCVLDIITLHLFFGTFLEYVNYIPTRVIIGKPELQNVEKLHSTQQQLD